MEKHALVRNISYMYHKILSVSGRFIPAAFSQKKKYGTSNFLPTSLSESLNPLAKPSN